MNETTKTDGDSHLVEVAVASSRVWQGKLLDVWRDKVRLPDGRSATREYIRHPGAVVIIALDAHNRVVMERQYRHPVGAVVEELPAGKLDAGEDPLTCAQRELQEETGYTAKQWRLLGSFWPCVGYSNEVIHVVLANEIVPGAARLDEGEFLEVFLLPVAELIARAERGQLRDGKSLAALCLARPHLLGG
ncbi:NUDIX domain-containing protein [Hydrogenophilus thermoluteolus]|uniref:NUDIX domain-containing protein n=1 Tax=Hydrogenophilus thermoluteolus TaxID=297 RepID=UPI0024A4221A|nr:NUDIX hydrolase [Hydrogenophilus thermoluteolus]GLW59665.1 NUDIX domain-containing protein [Hydrogenophilus thermoluteolus]